MTSYVPNYYKTLKPIIPPNILSLITLVQLLIKFGEVQHAREMIKQSKNFQHKHPEIYFQIGELFYELGMYSQATREFARALEIDPAMEIAKERIRTHQEGEENLHHVIEKIKLVLHHNPHYQEGYQKLAECYAKLGLYGFAEKAHQKALEMDDDTETNALFLTEAVDAHDKQQDFMYSKVDQELFLSIFKGKKNAHATQWVDELGKWGFMHIDRGLKAKDIYRHLKGETTFGIYPATEQDTVYFIVFDVDTTKRSIIETNDISLENFREKAHKDILRIKTVCENMDLKLYIEDSGYKGRHGWLFFIDEVQASWAVRLGNEIMKKAGGPSPQMIWELFPMGKSDRHQSIIKLPLGINRKNNRRCLFLTDSGIPVQDQALLLKSIQKNDIKKLKYIESAEKRTDSKGILSGEHGEIMAPPGIEKMVNRCMMLKHLICKARDTNYLNHYERICLLYTLSFAGEEGCKFLHKVIAYCINYDHHYTQRQIEKRKDSPISCAKIMENFPELAETLSCDCKFELPPRSYPSPVLYLLEAEMEGANIRPFSARNDNGGEDTEEKDKKIVEKKDNELAKESILDFESIFSSEIAGEMLDDVSDDRVDNNEESTSSADDLENAGIESVSPSLQQQNKAKESVNEDSRCKQVSYDQQTETDLCELFLEYLKIKAEQQKILNNLNYVSQELSEKFDKFNSDTIQTSMGCIQRIQQKDGKPKWKLET